MAELAQITKELDALELFLKNEDQLGLKAATEVQCYDRVSTDKSDAERQYKALPRRSLPNPLAFKKLERLKEFTEKYPELAKSTLGDKDFKHWNEELWKPKESEETKVKSNVYRCPLITPEILIYLHEPSGITIDKMLPLLKCEEEGYKQLARFRDVEGMFPRWRRFKRQRAQETIKLDSGQLNLLILNIFYGKSLTSSVICPTLGMRCKRLQDLLISYKDLAATPQQAKQTALSLISGKSSYFRSTEDDHNPLYSHLMTSTFFVYKPFGRIKHSSDKPQNIAKTVLFLIAGPNRNTDLGQFLNDAAFSMDGSSLFYYFKTTPKEADVNLTYIRSYLGLSSRLTFNAILDSKKLSADSVHEKAFNKGRMRLALNHREECEQYGQLEIWEANCEYNDKDGKLRNAFLTLTVVHEEEASAFSMMKYRKKKFSQINIRAIMNTFIAPFLIEASDIINGVRSEEYIPDYWIHTMVSTIVPEKVQDSGRKLSLTEGGVVGFGQFLVGPVYILDENFQDVSNYPTETLYIPQGNRLEDPETGQVVARLDTNKLRSPTLYIHDVLRSGHYAIKIGLIRLCFMHWEETIIVAEQDDTRKDHVLRGIFNLLLEPERQELRKCWQWQSDVLNFHRIRMALNYSLFKVSGLEKDHSELGSLSLAGIAYRKEGDQYYLGSEQVWPLRPKILLTSEEGPSRKVAKLSDLTVDNTLDGEIVVVRMQKYMVSKGLLESPVANSSRIAGYVNRAVKRGLDLELDEEPLKKLFHHGD